MNNIISLLLLLCLINGCSQEQYIYEGKKIIVYRNIDKGIESNVVEGLDLSSRELVRFPIEKNKLDHLVYLNLNDNNLVKLDSNVCNLSNLKVLLLSRNKSIELPDCFFGMSQLEVLSIIGCDIQISKAFITLKNLKKLVIAGNKFDEKDVVFLKQNLPNCNIITSVD
ncbi:MAG TPA: hypothetical protein PK185_11840 [Cyclobacteriaceae bacterium]|nr:hypothetical protein [Cyclobacteriaceae bacterium]